MGKTSVRFFSGLAKRLRDQLLGVASVSLGLLLWHLLTAGDVPEYRMVTPAILPSPMEVLNAFPVLVRDKALFASMAATLQRVVSGFGLAAVLAVPLGILAGVSGLFRAITKPYALFLSTIPVAVLIPLTLAWFGIDEKQKIIFLFIATAPFVFTSSANAIATVPDRFIDTALTLGATRRQVVTKVKVPMAMPDIYIALQSLFGLAFGYIMLAEIVNAPRGLGQMITTAQHRGDTPSIYAGIIVIALVAWLINATLTVFRRGFFPYRSNQE